ncbi:uncharacterized protein LOC121981926 [Zingiber officinale]|uniref:uncharacterized protein LOC121981926 n=1 Tax=Zingiber officinale TaxID=94328 RepID=UPI001C4D5D26|nr:uncharacterized protein LOC121981926 [Zingiber officinale]
MSLLSFVSKRVSLIRPSLASLQYYSSPSSSSTKVTEIYGNNTYLVDTSTLVRRLEAQGLPPNQAYIIISTLTTFLNTNLDHLTQSVVSKSAFNEFMAKQNSDLSQFKLVMKHMQDGHFNSVVRKNEKLERDFKKLVIKLTSKFNREIIEVEAGLKAAKFEIMKYCVGTFVSAGSICLAFVLFWK